MFEPSITRSTHRFIFSSFLTFRTWDLVFTPLKIERGQFTDAFAEQRDEVRKARYHLPEIDLSTPDATYSKVS